MRRIIWQTLWLEMVWMVLWGCAAAPPTTEPELGPVILHQESPSSAAKLSTPLRKPRSGNLGWTERVLTQAELDRLGEHDPELSPSIGKQLLARLNVIAPYYVADAIREGHPLRVPNDFSAFKRWTPLPRTIPEAASVSKLILVVKDLPFVGWYQNGQLVGDTYACIGKSTSGTRSGIFSVREKDTNHISRSYTNAYGLPAPMPWALRVYEHVWIHAGDITGGYCSHGCINLPVPVAPRLFDWASVNTPVVIVESLGDLDALLERNRANCTIYAQECLRRRPAIN